MSETWTEYAWQNIATGSIAHGDGSGLGFMRDCLKPGERIVGRTVTASDWLPVDTDGAK